jgi:hypothetical protein
MPNSKFDGRTKVVTQAEVSSWIVLNKADNTLLIILWLVSYETKFSMTLYQLLSMLVLPVETV